MKITCVLLLPIILLSGCNTAAKRSAQTEVETELDIMLDAMAPKSLQYAERISPEKYWIYNLFEAHDGRVIDLGRLDIAVGQVIEREGLPDDTFRRMRVEITGVEDDQLFLRSVWFHKDGQAFDSSGSLPVQRPSTEPGEGGGCSTNRDASAPRASEPESTHLEVYQRWDPENALREAESDIRHETVKIFYHGGLAAFPAGVDREDYDLIEDLPIEDAGIGCVVIDGKLRRMQSEFATIYNRRIIDWLRDEWAEPGEGDHSE